MKGPGKPRRNHFKCRCGGKLLVIDVRPLSAELPTYRRTYNCAACHKLYTMYESPYNPQEFVGFYDSLLPTLRKLTREVRRASDDWSESDGDSTVKADTRL